ncbi:pseudouridine synthase [Ramlibacter sp.]|uniref:pseudouridine synthase n=1 Tax=Ramlibacter sp. TaxID=1917967 RepID=UPI003D11C49A
MQLHQILFSQGFGTRRVCTGLVEQGFVEIDGSVHDDPFEQLDPIGLRFRVQGKAWEYHEKAYLLLNKPAGYECSQKPGAWPSVYTLLPAPLRQRAGPGATPGVQAIGRLDQDTTGLLLFSDDGKFIHRMASPKWHVPKVYRVTCEQPVDEKQARSLLAGVTLRDDPVAVKAAACEIVTSYVLDLTLTEGKYHQVKRMIAAVGNHVVALDRVRIGGIDLPSDLARGEWRWLRTDEVQALAGR